MSRISGLPSPWVGPRATRLAPQVPTARFAGGKSHSFGPEIRDNIDGSDGTITMNRTQVKGLVKAGGELTAQDAQLNDVYSDGSILFLRSDLAGTARSGGPLQAIHCTNLNTLRSESRITAEHCPSITCIKSGNLVELENSTVTGDVLAGGGVKIQDKSQIKGTLTVRTNKLEIEGGSKVNNIVVSLPEGVKLEPGKKAPQQEIILYNGSEIQGKIVFEGGNGIIRVRSGSKVPRKETITGGTLEAFGN